MQRHAQIEITRRALSARIALEFNGFNFIEANEYCRLVNEYELLFEGIKMSFVGSEISEKRKNDMLE
jgi:hypothetical protein